MKYKCDSKYCKRIFEDGQEIVVINENVGGLSLIEDRLSKKWVILCNNCFQDIKSQLVDEECWRDLQMMETDIKYFWKIGELQELLKAEDQPQDNHTQN